jgi:hypothetical protein
MINVWLSWSFSRYMNLKGAKVSINSVISIQKQASYKASQNSNHELKTKILEAECCKTELHTFKLRLCRACKEIEKCEEEIEKLIVILFVLL